MYFSVSKRGPSGEFPYIPVLPAATVVSDPLVFVCAIARPQRAHEASTFDQTQVSRIRPHELKDVSGLITGGENSGR